MTLTTHKFMNLMLCLSWCIAGSTSMAEAQDQLEIKPSLSTQELRGLDEFARMCAGQGLFGKAAEAYEIALKKARQSLGDEHRDVAQLHLSLAGAYRSLGERDKASAELERCIRVSQRVLGETNMLAAVALNQFGMLAAERAEDPKAETFYRRSLEMLDRLGDEAKPTTAAVAMNLGLLYHHKGNRAESAPLFERSLKLIQELGTPETANTAQVLNTLAWVFFDAMQYERASGLLRQSLAIREKVLGPAHPDLADSFDLLAAFASKTGDFNRAIAWLKLSLSFRKKAFGLNHQSVADILAELSNAQDSCGEYTEALANCERALGIRQTAFGSQSHEVVGSLLQLAALKSKSFRESEALELAQRAMDIEVKLHGPEHPHVADCLETLAATYFKLGKMPEVIESSGRCLTIRERTLGSTNLTTINTFEAFALLGIHLGQDELHHLKTALTRKEYLLGQENPSLVASLRSLGRVCRERDQFAEASNYLERALILARRSWGDEHPETLAVKREVLFLILRRGTPLKKCAEASAHLLKSERAWITAQLLGLSDRDALAFLHPLISDQTILYSLCGMASGKERFEVNQIAAEQLASCKALYEEVLSAKAKLESDSSTRAEELRERWHWLQSESMRLPELEPNLGLRERRRSELQEKLSDIETELYSRSGSARTEVFSRMVTTESLARALPQNALLCDVVASWRFDFAAKTNQWQEQRYAAYLTFPLARDATNVVVERVDLGEAAPINEAVELVCKRMSAGQFAAKDLSPALQRLSQLIYAPLAPYLTNVSHLIVCPDGQLSRLPFEMLPVGNKFLVEEKTISYVTSGREVVRIAKSLTRPPANSPADRSADLRSGALAAGDEPGRRPALLPSDGERAGRGAVGRSLVMGNPDFDLDLRSSRGNEALTKVPQPSTNNSQPESQSLLTSAATRALSRDFRGLKFGPLPGSGIEATNIAKLLGTDASLRLGADAREVELKAVISPRVLHLATHGFFLSDQELRTPHPVPLPIRWGEGVRRTGEGYDWENPLVRCGIALAGANRATNLMGRSSRREEAQTKTSQPSTNNPQPGNQSLLTSAHMKSEVKTKFPRSESQGVLLLTSQDDRSKVA